jgi:hypothetical protein
VLPIVIAICATLPRLGNAMTCSVDSDTRPGVACSVVVRTMLGYMCAASGQVEQEREARLKAALQCRDDSKKRKRDRHQSPDLEDGQLPGPPAANDDDMKGPPRSPRSLEARRCAGCKCPAIMGSIPSCFLYEEHPGQQFQDK